MTPAEFIKKQQKVAVVEFENNSHSIIPLVSVVVETYNHEKYIEECLNSIVNQKTEFSYEILVGEDASTDKTREICIEFAKKYPEKIRLFLHSKENKFFVNNKVTNKFNFIFNIYKSRGKFIARCEGDDYWTDENKLQKQVNFMIQNPEFGFTFHKAQTLLPNQTLVEFNKHSGYKNQQEVSKKEFIAKGGGTFATNSIIFKKSLLAQLPEYFLKSAVIDLPLALLSFAKTKIGYLSDSMSVYRSFSQSSMTQSRTALEKKKAHLNYLETVENFDQENIYKFRKELKTLKANLIYMSGLDQNSYLTKNQSIWNAIKIFPKIGLKRAMKLVFNKIRKL